MTAQECIAAGKPDDFIIRTELKEYGISAVQRRLVFDVLVLASEDKAMRVRIAAAFALGLIGDSDALEQLQELAKDPAFIVTAAPDKNTKSIVFPVRREAALALLGGLRGGLGALAARVRLEHSARHAGLAAGG